MFHLDTFGCSLPKLLDLTTHIYINVNIRMKSVEMRSKPYLLLCFRCRHVFTWIHRGWWSRTTSSLGVQLRSASIRHLTVLRRGDGRARRSRACFLMFHIWRGINELILNYSLNYKLCFHLTYRRISPLMLRFIMPFRVRTFSDIPYTWPQIQTSTGKVDSYS